MQMLILVHSEALCLYLQKIQHFPIQVVAIKMTFEANATVYSYLASPTHAGLGF